MSPVRPSIYLMVEGTVRVSRLAEARREVIVDIYWRGEFFGESGILELDPCCEQATALGHVRLMARTASVLDEIVMRNPHVALALCRILMRRIIVSNERSESFGMDSIPR